MPPLCTAGYGLAHLDGTYFFGALYLFLINTILIATSTTLVVRYLRFPVVQPLDAAKEQKYKRYFTLGLLALVLPSAYILYNTVRQSVQKAKIQSFVSETISFPGSEVVKQEVSFEEGEPRVQVVLLGATVPQEMMAQWQSGLVEKVPNARLEVVQNDGPSGLEDLQRMVILYAEGQTALSLRDAELVKLRTTLSEMEERDLPRSLPAEMLAQAPDIVGVEVANHRSLDRNGNELVVPWIDVRFAVQDSSDSMRTVALEQQLGAWLLLRLDVDTVALQVRPDGATP